jgi:hypothetical protein
VTPPLVGDERETLTTYLDWHRQTQFAGEDVPMLYYSDDDRPAPRADRRRHRPLAEGRGTLPVS